MVISPRPEAETSSTASTGGAEPGTRSESHLWVRTAFTIGIVLVTIVVAAVWRPWAVRPLRSPAPPPSTADAGASRATVPAAPIGIAVLPFTDLDGDKVGIAFADGLQDRVRAALAKVGGLGVIAQTSVTRYRQETAPDPRRIGRELGVAHLLAGTVRVEDGSVHVAVQLLDAATGARVWARADDRAGAGVLTLPGELARAVAGHLGIPLTPSERASMDLVPTGDLEAFDLCTRAGLLLEVPTTDPPEGNLRQAIELLERAVQRDPKFLTAYVRLAHAQAMMYLNGYDRTPGRIALNQAAADKVVALSPGSGEAHLALAFNAYVRADYDHARREVNAARKVLSNEPRVDELSAYIHRRQGRWEQSTRDFERALALDPRGASLLGNLAINCEALHRYADEAAIMDRVISLTPELPLPRLVRANIEQFWHADTRPLRRVIETLLQEDPNQARALLDFSLPLAFRERDYDGVVRALDVLGDGKYGDDSARFSRDFGLGMLARLRGDTEGARVAFTRDREAQATLVAAQPNDGPRWMVLAFIDAALGRKEEALRAGWRAVELTPLTRDSIKGPSLLFYLAAVEAWAGEPDLAIAQLRLAATTGRGPHYGVLMLDPMWDPLRSDPRFAEIVATLAPGNEKP